MSNRRKPKAAKRTQVFMKGLAKKLNQPSNREHVPTHDEMFGMGDDVSRYLPKGYDKMSPNMLVETMRAEAALTGAIIPDETFEKMGLRLELPTDEKVVIKEVPAKVDGVIVGTAYIHDDGTVAIKYKIRATADEVGYSLETGD
jgi:hypothetical protein